MICIPYDFVYYVKQSINTIRYGHHYDHVLMEIYIGIKLLYYPPFMASIFSNKFQSMQNLRDYV